MDYLYTLSGFGVGAIVGLTGVGGGSLMTPLLVLLFGVPPATAVGTDLLYAAITKAGGTVAHGRKGHIDWAITGRLAMGSIPAAAITVWILSQMPKGSNVIGQVISNGLGFALLLTSVAILSAASCANTQASTKIPHFVAAAWARSRSPWVPFSAYWSPSLPLAPAHSALRCYFSSIPNFRPSALSDQTSPMPCR
jgi:uncharacterized membrane protein YfcA